MNGAWGTVFWNQTYTSFREVYVPRTTPCNSANPHQVLDFYRFISESACNFAKMQSDIIRKYKKKDDFITTNGMYGNLDYHKLTAESLDFITYDSYPNFAFCLSSYDKNDLMKDREWSRILAENRAVSLIFGIMEQQSGANGWNTSMEAPTPRPGQITLWTMQSIAHGADFISYFRWRTSTVGTEIYWHGILDYSNRDNRRLREVQEISQKISRMQEIAGAEYVAKVGIIKDYDNIWDAQQDVWHGRVEQESQNGLYIATQLTHTPMDYVYLKETISVADLLKYEVLFYPHATILTEERVQLLEQYVVQGGTLVMGCRTGYKDMNGKCVMDHLPGLAQGLTGTDVLEYSLVAPDDEKVYVNWDDERVEAAVFNDILAPFGESAKVLASYEGTYYDAEPALIENVYGNGKVYYFGGAFALDTAKLFLKKLGVAEMFGDIIAVPECCEIAVRQKEDYQYLFVLNYSSQEVLIQLKKPLYDLLVQTEETGNIKLEKYGVKIYRMQMSEKVR